MVRLRSRTILPAAALLLCAACVPLPQEEGVARPASSGIVAGDFQLLDPGANRQDSLHLRVHAYGADRAQAVSELAETLYSRVMTDTGLYSFVPRGLYPIVTYASREEYLRKTRLPEWSGGISVGNSIFVYEGPRMPGILAHEMTHLIFFEYMGRSDEALRWVNEGLAVYEEQEALRAQGGGGPSLPLRKLPFREMIGMAPLSENQGSAGEWYLQVGSVVRFLIERGGRVGFSEFLKALHDGRGADEAVRTGFPGVWGGLGALESSWQSSF